ncbi:MAG TPA: hypothetical protein VMS88_08255 [Terriglobales bacterium]|nr:hypothetical protein [Terriglobales bacterium]
MSRRLLLSSLVLPLLVLFAPASRARSWAEWGPAPLPSDTSFLALSARPSDSLTASQLMWVAVQRDWRKQRDEEALAKRTLGNSGRFHSSRRTDERFAALASRPYEALSDDEKAWLVAENQLQRAGREESDGSNVVGVVLIGAAVAAGVAILVVANAFNHMFH